MMNRQALILLDHTQAHDAQTHMSCSNQASVLKEQTERTIWEASMAEPVANTQQRTQYAMPHAPRTMSLIRRTTLELNSSQPSA